MNVFSSIVIATIIVSFISFAGALLFIFKKLHSEKFLTYMISFAAGIMLATAFLDLLPEAFGGIYDASLFTAVLFGIVSFFLLERFILWFHHHDERGHTHPISLLVLLGDSFHNFFDGLAIAAAFLINPGAGIATTLAITAHEIPHEIADFGILLHEGMGKKKALFFNFLSALTALAGAVGGYFFLNNILAIESMLLAFTAGNFVYIACSDLIPQLHRSAKQNTNWKLSLPFLGGLFIAWLMISLLS